MTLKTTYFGKNIDKYIEFSEEEKTFMREFKLLMLDGLTGKKYCGFLRYVFRTYKITYDLDRLVWNSKKVSGPHEIMFKDILSIGDYSGIKISDELKKRVVVIKHRIHIYNDTKDTILEFCDEQTRNLFTDGLKLVIKEYRMKIIKKKE